MIWLWGVHSQGWSGLVGRNVGGFGSDVWTTSLLILSGPITAGPLILATLYFTTPSLFVARQARYRTGLHCVY